ncbi:hypothetical protein [Winogradskyella aurantiaca]|uniref:hypothetical protein n=1 Tax=Winogradskyella aurantiaca TaxID=2219558 RepID=UPI000E1C5412|nr:hypothetical protein [Winogradskyella aurantiaca]
MNTSFNLKAWLGFTVAFMLFTVIGTLSHEYGHIAVAQYLGYETELHYSSMNYYPKGYSEDADVKQMKVLMKDYRDKDYEEWPKDVKEKRTYYSNVIHERYWEGRSIDILLILIGGPLQTMLTGVLGLLILYWRRASIKRQRLKIGDWLAVFLALFWLREVFNLVMSIIQEFTSPNGYWFGGDEVRISIHLDIWDGTVPVISGLLGLICASYVVFYVLPKSLRLSFILSGVIGGSLGFYLWMFVLGPQILP